LRPKELKRQYRRLLAVAIVYFVFAHTIAAAARQQSGSEPASPLNSATGSPAPNSENFSAEEIAKQSLNQIRHGLEARNSRTMLAPFDRDRMQGYLTFRDQVESFFAQYDSFRVFIRIESANADQDHATATALFTLECVPRDNSPDVRREAELTFQFVRTPSGWKIVDLSPRSFFS